MPKTPLTARQCADVPAHGCPLGFVASEFAMSSASWTSVITESRKPRNACPSHRPGGRNERVRKGLCVCVCDMFCEEEGVYVYTY